MSFSNKHAEQVLFQYDGSSVGCLSQSSIIKSIHYRKHHVTNLQVRGSWRVNVNFPFLFIALIFIEQFRYKIVNRESFSSCQLRSQ